MNITNKHLAGSPINHDAVSKPGGNFAPADETTTVVDMGAIESNDKNTITRLLQGASENLLTPEEWRQIRRAAGMQINPKTAEFMWVYSADLEENGPDPSRGYAHRLDYYRAPGSDEWVSVWDLPEAVRHALWENLPDEFF